MTQVNIICASGNFTYRKNTHSTTDKSSQLFQHTIL